MESEIDVGRHLSSESEEGMWILLTTIKGFFALLVGLAGLCCFTYVVYLKCGGADSGEGTGKKGLGLEMTSFGRPSDGSESTGS